MIDQRAVEESLRSMEALRKVGNTYEKAVNQVRSLSVQLKQEARRAASLQRKSQGQSISIQDSQIMQSGARKVIQVTNKLRVLDKLLQADIRLGQRLQQLVGKIDPRMAKDVAADVRHMQILRQSVQQLQKQSDKLLKMLDRASTAQGVSGSVLAYLVTGLGALFTGLAVVAGSPAAGVLAVGTLGLFGINRVWGQLEKLRQ